MPLKSHHCHAVNQVYHQYRVVKVTPIAELQCELIELIHEPSGAMIMHIKNDDSENLFCLSFQTLPKTSNGVAHILEHTVLCGSKKYPVKDPFFAMQRRSLNTFMNALTGSDFTCYPAASQVPKDFYNLLEVYLDAVFHPNLNELSFLQEGYRLEFANPQDTNSPLEYKGIVFNEMKGAMASASARLTEAMNRALFPDLTYGINSGGDPKNIPELSYQELREFHDTYYHPSRCLFFFYGNMPLEGHLDFLSEKILKETKKAPPLSPIPSQPRFSEPRRETLKYPIPTGESSEDKTLIAFGWLTCPILEQQDLLALSILEIILMDTDASPLKMAFLKSGLCKQALCYMDDEITEVPVIITLKGCNPDSADELEKLMMSTLRDIAQRGIPLNLVENAMHQLEFFRSEITGDHTPFGLSLFMRSALTKQHGGLPERGLKIHSLFDEIRRQNLQDPFYFSKLIEKYFLNNSHFVRIVMVPNRELASEELQEEKITLERIKEALSEKEKEEIKRKAAELAAFQKKQEEEDTEILPKVTLKDVPSSSKFYPLSVEKIGNFQVFHHNCFTNNIVYTDLLFDLPELSEKDLSYLRILTSFFSQMGCKARKYAENLEYIQANTGGIGASLALHMQAHDNHLFSPSLSIRGKALYPKASKLFTLIYEMTSSVSFKDVNRLREVLLKLYTGLQSSLSQNGLRYAINLSASGIDVPSKIANIWYGLDYYLLIERLALNFDQYKSELVETLEELKTRVLCLQNPHLILTCDTNMYHTIKGNQLYDLKQLESRSAPPWKGDYPLKGVEPQARLISSPIAFIAQVMKTVPYIHPDAPALNLAACLFDHLTLHSKVREQGGAYGGGAVSNSLSGNFYFYSYRDPNISTTLKAFEKAIKEVIKGNFDAMELEESKLEMIQNFDAPVAPGSRGDLAYGWLREGKTQDIRQEFRKRLLELTKEEVVTAVETHLLPAFYSSVPIVFAGKELVEKENGKLIAMGKPPFPLKKI